MASAGTADGGPRRTVTTLVRAVGGSILAAVLVACAGATSDPADALAGADPVVLRGQPHPVELGTLTSADVAAAEQSFGLDVLHAMCAEAPGQNLLLSPTSAAVALGLLYPAASGATAQDVGSLLHLPEWSPDLVAAVAQRHASLTDLAYDGDLDADDAPDSLRISNHLWTRPGLEPRQTYLDDIATAHDADVQMLDFAADPVASTDRINAVVEDDTAGVIDELFARPLGTSTVAVLVNAIHLKARWATPFRDSRDAPFHSAAGDVTVQMMQAGEGEARTADGWTSVELPYLDGTLAAVAVLPPVGTDPCSVDSAVLDAVEGAEPERVGVAMPQLEIEQSHQLLDLLTGLGLPPKGDYSGLCESCFITEVVQATFLEVDEQGTEAAAATGVVMEESGPPEAQVVLDRPYLLVLTDTETRSPLFMTVVHDPTAG